MFGLSTGTVYGKPDVKSGGARLTDKNSQRAGVGSKLLLYAGGKKFRLEVVEIVIDNNDAIQDDVIISSENGVNAVSGSYKRISNFRYSVGKAFGTKKGRATATYTVGSIISAALASIAASQKDQCSGLQCVKWYTWGLIGISAFLSFYAWYKDNAM
jgi:hypothetical protein